MAKFTTARGLDRIVNFSDATVAIALTLLVLPLADLATQGASAGVGPLLAHHVDDILSLLISFVVIAAIWYEHHALFVRLAGYSGWLILFNFIWLFAVVLLPFNTAVVENARSDDRVALTLYIGDLVVAFGMIAAMRLQALGRPELIEPDARADFGVLHSFVMTGLAAASLIVAVSAPTIGPQSLLLLLLARPVGWLLSRRRRAR